MRIKSKSYFKNEKVDFAHFEGWVTEVENFNERQYERFEIETSLRKTQVYGLNTKEETLEILVLFPRARTTALIWDIDKGLDNPHHKIKIFMVEPNGLPNLSNGNSPNIKSLDYGFWVLSL